MTVGILYIIGTVSGILCLVFTAGLLDDQADLEAVASHGNDLRVGALLVLVMGLSLAMVSVFMFPILRRQNETLAIGYVVFRGALETLLYVATVMSWLFLLVTAREYVDAPAATASSFRSLGIVLIKGQEPAITAVQGIVFSLGALMFYYLLYRARLIPRWLSGWGIVGVAGYLVGSVLGVFDTDAMVLLMPLAVQEMVMAIWLIVKGFNPALASESGQPSGHLDRRLS